MTCCVSPYFFNITQDGHQSIETSMALHNADDSSAARSQTAIDLTNARSLVSFPIDQLANLIHGHQHLQRKEYLLSLIVKDPVFSKKNRFLLPRDVGLLRALQMSKRLIEIKNQFGLSTPDLNIMRALIDEIIPLSLHEVMFIPVLKTQCSPEQAKYWVPLADKYRILGSYAQTELAHGSNLSGLQTTARYIPDTDEFEIHSPDITAAKWWIGSLGILSTHTLVQAKLLIDHVDHGPHLFIVPIRSLETHVPFPGIRVGDIGPKLGYNLMDNGWIMFDRYRIPRQNMLMRFAQVTRQGQYIKPPHSKLGYGGMVLVRVSLVQGAAHALAKASTIAVRYATMRRQFHVTTTAMQQPESLLETPILMYPMVQSRILPRVAESYAIAFASRELNAMYESMTHDLESMNVSTLPTMHATSSALKSYCTDLALNGIEEVRRACGGHAYLFSSGLPHLLINYAPTVTFEGENSILTQQTARYLLKQVDEVNRHPMVAYLTNVGKSPPVKCTLINSVSDWFCPSVQEAVFAHRSVRLVTELRDLVAQTGALFGDLNLECQRVSVAHSQYVLVTNFHRVLDQPQRCAPSVLRALKYVCDLFAVSEILKSVGDFTEDGYLSARHVQLLRTAYRTRLGDVAKEAVGLVDAWLFSDYELDSCIARTDGRIYEALFQTTLEDPVNQGLDGKAVCKGYEAYIRPLVTGRHTSGRGLSKL